ncbi:MAG: D-tyrosyl-tRNA(Tyr) deacylase [Clostridia bacterium]|nr:D-tyrosyl-tRNA(Tyr) deacylase [Clostridia bacterium]
MKAVVQRVSASSVSVDGAVVGSIGRGYNVLLGVVPEDTEREADLLAAKIAKLRVFKDAEGRMNMSLSDVGGGVLVISQFTLCADIRKGNRPSFTTAAAPERAEQLYEYFIQKLRDEGVQKVEHGSFGDDMKVEISNDGPVTIIMDTDIWLKKV